MNLLIWVKNLKVNFWISNKNGFLAATKIGGAEASDILICGPSGMMSALKKQFLEQGITENKIHAEEFQLY